MSIDSSSRLFTRIRRRGCPSVLDENGAKSVMNSTCGADRGTALLNIAQFAHPARRSRRPGRGGNARETGATGGVEAGATLSAADSPRRHRLRAGQFLLVFVTTAFAPRSAATSADRSFFCFTSSGAVIFSMRAGSFWKGASFLSSAGGALALLRIHDVVIDPLDTADGLSLAASRSSTLRVTSSSASAIATPTQIEAEVFLTTSASP